MKRRTLAAVLVMGALVTIGVIAAISAGSHGSKAAAPAATVTSNPLDAWGPAAEAQIPVNFTPDKFNDACVTKLIEATYPAPRDFLDDLHAIGPTGIVSKTGVVACYIG